MRVTELRKDGFVEFELAIGEPELFAELMLPAAAFDEFCVANKVIFLDEGDEANDWGWRLRDVSKQRFR